jgi:LytS/YehU family sensor histidine kinase
MVNNQIFKRTEFWIYIFASMIILFFILYMQQKNSYQLQQKILSLELSTIRSNMNPHFVFNVMNFVQAMIVKSDQRKALKATSELAHLNRLFLETTNKEVISLKNELNLARKYINLEKLRFESDKTFEFSISIEKNIDTNSWFLPPLVLQPLLENAVKHGVLLLEKKLGKIKIYVLQIAPNEIDIIVQNTGQGETFKRIGGTGIGQKLVNDRILLFNRKFNNEYFAQFSSNFDGNFYNCHLTIKKLN